MKFNVEQKIKLKTKDALIFVYEGMECKVNAFMEDLNSLKVENLEKWFNEDSTIWIPPAGQVTGARRILALFRAIFRKYSKLEWRVDSVFSIGSHQFFYQTSSRGNFANDSEYRNQICTIIHFCENGKIKYLSDYFKDTSCFN